MRELILLLVALILHECGHILAASIMSIPVRSVNICAIGAAITFDFSRVGYAKEAIVHFSGPLFGIVSGIGAHLAFGESANYFAGVSVVLTALNLLPIRGFDGGGLLRCLLSLFFLPDTVWRICRGMSVISVLILWSGILWIELRAGVNLGLLIFIIGILLGKIN
ncbi:MAG: hypothetical protein E7627_01395 [Ruminococcaceae bacterium]|nr:hypothetical protein [Oscillospiraceae bacterium]